MKNPNAEKPEPVVDQKLLDFINKNVVRCRMWAQAHGNTFFPIVKDPSGEYHWVNRKNRRFKNNKLTKEK